MEGEHLEAAPAGGGGLLKILTTKEERLCNAQPQFLMPYTDRKSIQHQVCKRRRRSKSKTPEVLVPRSAKIDDQVQ